MANLRLRSIKFPTLPDTYVVKDYDADMAQMQEDVYNLFPRKSLPSAAIHAFADGADNIPVKAMEVAVRAVQSGSGDPSPDNVRPISGWSNAKIYGTGKNLFDPSKIVQSSGATVTVAGDTVTISGAASRARGNYNPASLTSLPAGRKYTLSFNIDSITGYASQPTFFGFAVLKADGTYRYPSASGTSTTGAKSVTVTLAEGEVFARIDLNVNDQGSAIGSPCTYVLSDIQLEVGETATTYAPYNGNIVTIDFNGTVYGGTLKYKGGDEYELVIDQLSVDLGTLNWQKLQPTAVFWSVAIPNIKMAGGPTIIGDFLSSALTPDTSAHVSVGTTDNTIAIHSANNNVWAYIAAHENDTPQQFAAAVSGYQFVYHLATPVVTTLTSDEPTTVYGDNVLFADCGDSALTYRQDIGLLLAE